MKYCGLLLHGSPLEHWNKSELIKLIIRLVLFPQVKHVEKTQEFIRNHETEAHTAPAH